MNQDPVVGQLSRQDLGLAVFGLGRFIQYRLDEGMDPADLVVFKQAYLNLSADLSGQERLALDELQSRTEAVLPKDLLAIPPAWPQWLFRHEQLQVHLCRIASGPDTSCPSQPEQPLPTP